MATEQDIAVSESSLLPTLMYPIHLDISVSVNLWTQHDYDSIFQRMLPRRGLTVNIHRVISTVR